jgi:hypothetical protein
MVLRRYSDFDWLRAVLVHEHDSHFVPVRMPHAAAAVAAE